MWQRNASQLIRPAHSATKGWALLALRAASAILFLPMIARADEPLGIRAVAFSPDGKLIAAGSGEPKEHGHVTIWDVSTRKQRWQHPEKDGVPAVAFAPDGKLLAIAVYDGAARLLDVETGEVKTTLKHPR
jgi:WD40 repeat protein